MGVWYCDFSGLKTTANTIDFSYGSAIRAEGGVVQLGYSTFAANSVESTAGFTRGGAVYASLGHIQNCVFTGNRAMGSDAAGGAVSLEFGTIAACTFHANRAETPDPLTAVGGAIDAGPDGVAGTSDDDLRLRPLSPCIDSGTNAYSGFNLLSEDVLRFPRFHDDPGSLDRGDGSRLDRGAFEFQGQSPTTCRRDINLDGVVDIFDLTNLLRWFGLPVPPRYGPDYDGDGVVGTPDLVQLLADFGCVRG